MADALELHVTMPDKERATSLARALVDEGLAACVNVVPGVRSVYQWDGRLQEDEEVLCLIKTRPAVFDARPRPHPGAAPVRGPEILAFAVDDGSATYLEWLKKSTALSGGPGFRHL
jgi:periplasmic divalent cation tolerance protein